MLGEFVVRWGGLEENERRATIFEGPTNLTLRGVFELQCSLIPQFPREMQQADWTRSPVAQERSPFLDPSPKTPTKWSCLSPLVEFRDRIQRRVQDLVNQCLLPFHLLKSGRNEHIPVAMILFKPNRGKYIFLSKKKLHKHLSTNPPSFAVICPVFDSEIA